MDNETREEEAFLDFMEARERALDAAAGYFTTANIPSWSLRIIADTATEPTITLAARIVLYQREGS